jgi:hypothetical protein
VAAERTELQALQVQTRRAISDVAFNRPQRRRKVGAGDVGRAAAGTAASVLLPFGIGIALTAVAGAATRGKKKNRAAAEPQADVPALIDRQHAIEARLKELAALPCPAVPATAQSASGETAPARSATGKSVPPRPARSAPVKALVVPGPPVSATPRE